LVLGSNIKIENTNASSSRPYKSSRSADPDRTEGLRSVGNDPSSKVLEAELVEISERLRQTRYQLDEERQKRHLLRDELDEVRRSIEDERVKFREVSKQLVILEEDRMTHDIQVGRLREQIEQNVSLKESLQLDLDRARMQLFHAREKYETAIKSIAAENEALRKKIDLLNIEISEVKNSGPSTRDTQELETQNAILRQVIEKYRRALPSSRFPDSVDAVSSTAFDAQKLSKATDFLNSLMEALDKAKFLNKQMQQGSNPSNKWSAQSWQDLCVGWKETVCELCDLFAAAHRIEGTNQAT
jgi:chromosome segregation ATPase